MTTPRDALGMRFPRPKFDKDELRRRPPVLDDSHVQTVWNAADINWESVAEQRAQTIAYQQGTIHALQSALFGARFDRDIYWPLAFCVGIICGMGLAVIW